ncbi:MAG: B12-binding domain-containing radical SAM protein [Rhodothermales bacterium]
MRKLNIAVIDILGKSASRKAYSRHMRANNQSIGPQVVAVWCEELGHKVSMVYFDGPDLYQGAVPDDVDIVFINAFSQNAMLAYALSNYYQSKGAVTALGGPHARSYPDDTAKYFDYAIGFCDKDLLRDILQDCSPHRPLGQVLSARQQPSSIPGVRQRWKFMQPILEKAPFIRMIPMIGSLGCPYTCSFCIDAGVPYQPLEFDSLQEDLRFIVENKAPRTIVAWHDPNFGIRFDEFLGAIEEAIRPGSLTFLAEMSLSLLNENHLKRLRNVGFKAIAPGIESWYDIGDKSKMRSTNGMEKVRRVAEKAELVQSYIPYMQANLILGLDSDDGPEPFELSKKFIDLAPGVFPYYSLLMSYGRNAPDNLRYQREGRVLNIPFHFLNQLHSMNVRPKNYTWLEFFTHVCDLYAYAHSKKAMYRRFMAKRHMVTRVEQLFRSITSERNHKLIGNHMKMRERLKTDKELVRYLNGETTELPEIYVEPIQRDLKWLWEWLPEGALYHDPNAYLNSLNGEVSTEAAVQAGMAVA